MDAATQSAVVDALIEEFLTALSDADDRSEAFGARMGSGVDRHLGTTQWFEKQEVADLRASLSVIEAALRRAAGAGTFATEPQRLQLLQSRLAYASARLEFIRLVNFTFARNDVSAKASGNQVLEILGPWLNDSPLCISLAGQTYETMDQTAAAIAMYLKVADLTDSTEVRVDVLKDVAKLEARLQAETEAAAAKAGGGVLPAMLAPLWLRGLGGLAVAERSALLRLDCGTVAVEQALAHFGRAPLGGSLDTPCTVGAMRDALRARGLTVRLRGTASTRFDIHDPQVATAYIVVRYGRLAALLGRRLGLEIIPAHATWHGGELDMEWMRTQFASSSVVAVLAIAD
jgi:hypothetical protein